MFLDGLNVIIAYHPIAAVLVGEAYMMRTASGHHGIVDNATIALRHAIDPTLPVKDCSILHDS